MKIIFENEQEMREIIKCFGDSSSCPYEFNLKILEKCEKSDSVDMSWCPECWRRALEEIAEVQNEDSVSG